MSTTPATLDAELRAADAIADVIEHWGFRKALGRVWTILYLEGGPLSAAEIGQRLSMSSGAVSMALTELQRWAVVRRVWMPGERREFFEAETDLWKMISKVINERERGLIVSARERLAEARARLEEGPATDGNRARIGRVQHLLTLSVIAENLLEVVVQSKHADFSSLSNVLQLSRQRRTPRSP